MSLTSAHREAGPLRFSDEPRPLNASHDDGTIGFFPEGQPDAHNRLSHQLEPLRDQYAGQRVQAGDISARACEPGHDAGPDRSRRSRPWQAEPLSVAFFGRHHRRVPRVTIRSTFRRSSSAASCGKRSGGCSDRTVVEDEVFTLHVAKLAQALRKGLRELGYVEGKNLVLDYRSVDGRPERFPQLAAELLRLNVDLIVTRGTPAVMAAKNATETVPVVMAASGEPVGTGVVAGLARPGGNVTGLSALTSVLIAKRLELMREAVVGIRRIAFLFNMGNPIAPSSWEEFKAAAPSLNFEAQLLDVRKFEDIVQAFDTAIAHAPTRSSWGTTPSRWRIAGRS